MPKHPDSGFTRIACFDPCEVEHGSHLLRGLVWDVSVVGAYIVLDELPDIGAELNLTFTLPGDPEPITTRARVAWQNAPSQTRGLGQKALDLPPGCGVEFEDLLPADQARIEERVRTTEATARALPLRSEPVRPAPSPAQRNLPVT